MATQAQFNQLPVGLQNQITSALRAGDKAKAQQLLEQGTASLGQPAPAPAPAPATTPVATPTAVTTPAPASTVIPNNKKNIPTLSNVQEQYKSLIASGMTKEQATAQLKTKLQSTPTSAGVSAYDKLKAQYKAPSTLKVEKTTVEKVPETYQASNGAKYNLTTNPDGTVQFISAQTGQPRVFKNRQDAVSTIESVAQQNKAKDILSPTNVGISKEKVTELSGKTTMASDAAAKKKAMVSKITTGTTLKPEDQAKIDTLSQISDEQIRAEEENLNNYKAQLKQSTADIVNLNNRRALELKNQMNEQIAANKAKVDQNTSIVLSQLGGRARALSQVIKDGVPLDDASMIALMGETGVTAMQGIVDAKNKMVDANNKITEDSTAKIFELEQKNEISKADAEKAIFALEYQSKLNAAKITSDFYNSVFGVVDTAKVANKTDAAAIEDRITTMLNSMGLTAQEIGLVRQQLGTITDPTKVDAAIYALAKKQGSALYKANKAAEKRATSAAQSKLDSDIAIKEAGKATSNTGLAAPSATEIQNVSGTAQQILGLLGVKFDPNTLKAGTNNYDNYYNLTQLISANQGEDLIIPGALLGVNQDVKVKGTAVGKIKNALANGKWDKGVLSKAEVSVNTTTEPTKTTTTAIATPENITKIAEDTRKKIQSGAIKKGFAVYPDGSGIIYTGDNKYIFINNKGQVSAPTVLGKSPNISNVSGYTPDTNQINKNNEVIRKLVSDGTSYGTIIYPAGGSITFTGGGLYVYTKPDGTKSLPTPVGKEPIYKK